MFQKGLDPSEVAGDFGNHSLYKNLGYFSLIGLLRLHTQLGDYYNALDSVRNVTISKKVREVAIFLVVVSGSNTSWVVTKGSLKHKKGDFLLQVLANTRVPASQIALYYYVGFCYLMMRRYQVCSSYTYA